ncbi:MAG: glycosyltransferase family 4 protein [Oscillochloridaceae bacterium]|nr:glycosyltransferase family 4 protein [Chloroflexaceae bacterium]MDW8389269.1 glycosyltransferase family 4 protein [Oscillochloridaceae bacterium]
MRLLLVSHDVVGARMAGPGIRYWELARALAAHHEVRLIAPQPVDLQHPGVATGAYRWGEAASLAAHTAQAEAVLANGYVLEAHPELADVSARLILDLYDPTLLENLELLRDRPESERLARHQRDVALLQRQLAAGDLLLCATERQRDLYLGALMAAGRITPALTDRDPLARTVIDVLPFGLPAEPPARGGEALRGVVAGIGPDDPLILWSGGLWDWMDPLTLLRAMPAVVERHPRARLVFLAGRHPGVTDHPRAGAQARALAAELGLLDRHVFFYEEWVPYFRRADFLFEATVVASLHRQHLETAYAALRSRFLDCLWVGVPVVWSDGDAAAALVREHDCGLVVPPEDPTAVAAALETLLSDDALRTGKAMHARALAPRFAWPELIRPLLEWLAAPPPRAATRTPPLATAPPEAAPPPTDVTLVERGNLILATRNAALQALDATWRLDGLSDSLAGRFAALRRRLLDQVVWPMLYPLLARQQEQNAAVIRALYASAEHGDYLAQSIAQLKGQLDLTARRLDHLDLLDLRIDHLREGLSELSEHVREVVTKLSEQTVRERHLLSQQVRDFAEQLAGLEESEMQLRALLRGDTPPAPRDEEARR